jgi:hypothetical protein
MLPQGWHWVILLSRALCPCYDVKPKNFMIMKVTFRVKDPMTMRVFKPDNYRAYADRTESVFCGRVERMGNLIQLFNHSGFTMFSLDAADVISIEK